MMRACCLAVTSAFAASLAVDASAQIATGPVAVTLEAVDPMPVEAGSPVQGDGTGTGYLLVAGREGRVEIFQNGSYLSPLLDITSRVITGGERGLLGLAVHPEFATPGADGYGRFYTFHSESRSGAPAPDFNHPELVPGNLGDHHDVVTEWTADPMTLGAINAAAGREILRINQPQGNHNGGGLAFSNDGLLYVAVGDGGGGNDFSGSIGSTTDGHTNATATTPHGNGQDNSNVYGSILRIDPLAITGNVAPNGAYSVPGDNPFVGDAGVAEIFAYGLRNPYRISVDRATGDLWAGDVGQNNREEVDLITSGGNYGWVVLEGTRVNFAQYDVPAGAIAPVAEYDHANDGGVSITGGYVYRGSLVPDLVGKYVFADLSGDLYYLDPAEQDPTILALALNPGSDAIAGSIFGFGEDDAGELYVLYGDGTIQRIVPEPGAALTLLTMGLALLSRRHRKQTAT